MTSKIRPDLFRDGQPVDKRAFRETLEAIRGEIGHGGFVQLAGMSQPRPVADKLGEWISVKDFGAVGDGRTDDTATIQAALDAARGRQIGVILPEGDYLASALDATGVAHIQAKGWIVSTIGAGETAVLLGAVEDSNTELNMGDICLRVRYRIADNATIPGSQGIAVLGAAYCHFRLQSLFFDVGICLRPQDFGNGGARQYIAFSHFQMMRTYGCRVGLLFDASNGSWINENIFSAVSISAAGNKLGKKNQGIVLAGSYASNNNLFIKPHVESLDEPIVIVNGVMNRFTMVRLEGSGPIVLGDGTSEPRCGHNLVTSLYHQDGAYRPRYEHRCWLPNIVCAEPGPVWSEILNIGACDWQIGADRAWYCHPLRNGVTQAWSFAHAHVDCREGLFDLGANHRACAEVPVRLGDILRIEPTVERIKHGAAAATVRALDRSRQPLADLAKGELPYLGFNRVEGLNVASTASGSIKDSPAAHEEGFLDCVSVNRNEVFFVEVQLRAGIVYRGLSIRKLANSYLSSTAAQLKDQRLLIWIDDERVDLPERVGSIGIRRDLGGIFLATAGETWTKLG